VTSNWLHVSNKGQKEREKMRTKFQLIAFALGIVFSLQSQAQKGNTIFPKGELSTAKNHTGNVWLKELDAGDSTFDYAIAVATFDSGAKLDWHMHPGGQILLILEGTGYYQERGKPIQIVHKGDVIKCLPSVEHWHGASPTTGFTYLATTPTKKGKTVWLEPVADKDYRSVK
jgi:quercetin dioxygenase-like cupin family protein